VSPQSLTKSRKHGSTILDRKRIYTNPSSYPNPNSNSNPNPNPNSNSKDWWFKLNSLQYELRRL